MAPRTPDIYLGPVQNIFLESLNAQISKNEVTAVHTPQVKRPPVEIVWKNVILIGGLYVGAMIGLYLTLYSHPYILFSLLFYDLSCLVITAGAHSLLSHCTYSAKLLLRIFLAIFSSSAVEAYNLKEVSPEVNKKRHEKWGDGTTGFNMIRSSEKSSIDASKKTHNISVY